MLRCDQEKAKGRFSYLERQLNKAQAEENCRDRERKTFEKEKRVEGLMEAESMKNTNKDIGYVYDPQLMVKLKSNAQGSRLTKAGCIVVSEPLSKTAPMDKTDGGDDISRPISSSGSQSSIDILGFTIFLFIFFSFMITLLRSSITLTSQLNNNDDFVNIQVI